MCVKAKDTFEKDCNQGNVPANSCLSDFFISVESDDKAKIALRDLGDRDEMVKEEWSESISGIIDDIGSRMSQLLLKDEPVTVAPSAIEDDVMVLKEVLQNACDDYSDKYRARDDLRHMPKLERRLNQDGCFQSTYLSEVRGT
jgi:hypothetical protein